MGGTWPKLDALRISRELASTGRSRERTLRPLCESMRMAANATPKRGESCCREDLAPEVRQRAGLHARDRRHDCDTNQERGNPKSRWSTSRASQYPSALACCAIGTATSSHHVCTSAGSAGSSIRLSRLRSWGYGVRRPFRCGYGPSARTHPRDECEAGRGEVATSGRWVTNPMGRRSERGDAGGRRTRRFPHAQRDHPDAWFRHRGS